MLEPHILVERDKRWYVIGYSQTAGERRVLALDRVDAIREAEDQRPTKPWSDYQDLLNAHMGIHLTDDPIVVVVLHVTPVVGRLLESLPIHPSQQITERTEAHWALSIEVANNFDLLLKIVALGVDAQVMSPTAVRDRVGAYVQQMAQAYKA